MAKPSTAPTPGSWMAKASPLCLRVGPPPGAPAAAREGGPTAVAAVVPATPPPSPAPTDSKAARPVQYRFTVKGDNLYAIAQSWPGETATIVTLAAGKLVEGAVPESKITSV